MQWAETGRKQTVIAAGQICNNGIFYFAKTNTGCANND